MIHPPEHLTIIYTENMGDKNAYDMARMAAMEVLSGNPIPEDFEDVLKIDRFTRPSGSSYVKVSFA
jgi:hypothetical protein